MKIVLKNGDVNGIQVTDDDGNDLVKKLRIMKVDIKIAAGKQPTACLHCITDELDIELSDTNMLHRVHNREALAKNNFSRVN